MMTSSCRSSRAEKTRKIAGEEPEVMMTRSGSIDTR